jgi:hypothetical protein
VDNVVALDEGRSGLVRAYPTVLRRLAIVIGLAVGGWLALTLLSSAAHADPAADVANADRTAVSAPVRALDKLVDVEDADEATPDRLNTDQLNTDQLNTDRPLAAVAATVSDVVSPVGATVGLVAKALPALDLVPTKAAPVHTGHGKHHDTPVVHHQQSAPVAALPIATAPQQPRTVSPISLPAPQPVSTGLPDLAPGTAPAGAAHSGAGATAMAIPAQRPEMAAPTGPAQPRPAGSWRVRNAALDPSVSPD